MLDFNIVRAAALVTAASTENAQRAFDTLTLAFVADPPSRWMFPDERQYLQYFPIFAKAFGGAALAQGTALASPDLRCGCHRARAPMRMRWRRSSRKA